MEKYIFIFVRKANDQIQSNSSDVLFYGNKVIISTVCFGFVVVRFSLMWCMWANLRSEVKIERNIRIEYQT